MMRGKRKHKRGISALPSVLLISAIIIEVALAGVIVANSLNNARLSERLAAEALAAARAGAQDAIVRVIRFKNCPSSPDCPASYTLSVGDRTADVTIAADTPAPDQITIESVGTAFTRQKKMRVVVGVNPVTGQVKLQLFEEGQL